MLLAYVYAPLQAQLDDVIRFAVLPVLAVTGIAPWQAARIGRTLRAVRATRAPKAHPNNRKERQVKLREMDEHVTYMRQLQQEGGPIVLVNVFNVAPEDAQRLLEVWADDAAYMRQQRGFISTQLHRGTAGSSTFVNVAEWESAAALGEAFGSPGFQARLARYPDSAIASPHVFERVTVPGT